MTRQPRYIPGLAALVLLSLHAWLSISLAGGNPAAIEPPDTAPPTPPLARDGIIGAGTSTVLPSGANIAVIPIKGSIYDFTLESIRHRVQRAKAAGATLIVFELDTPGGVLTSALNISTEIKNLPLPAVAWVNPHAYSAGIMIAASCNSIVMAPASAAGDCAPIVPGMNLSPTERAKALSPILTEFRDSARRNQQSFVLYHAMCELGVEVYEVESTSTRERRYVNQADFQVMVKGATPDSVRDAARARAAKLLSAAPQQQNTVLPGLSGHSSASTPVLALEELGGHMPDTATDSDRNAWTLVKQIHDGNSLLTLHQNEALDLGLSQAIIRDDAELQLHLGAASVTRYPTTWSESAASWLVHPLVRAALVLIMLLSAYIEFQSPGIGVAGAIAVIALILLIVSPLLIGLAEMWHILLFLVGLGLLIYEFVTPGFAIFGVTGILFMLTGLILAVVPTTGQGPVPMPAPEMAARLQQSVIYTVLALFAAVPGFWLITKHFGKIPGLNRLVLQTPAGPIDTSAFQRTSGDEALGAGHIHVGDKGTATTELRPSGRASIGGQTVDVVTPGNWIAPGTPIRITQIEGNHIVVETY